MDKKELYKLAGNKLREMRKATGLSVFKVGRAIGVSGNYISEIERGTRPASDGVLMGISDLYGVDKNDLFSLYERLPNDEAQQIMAHPELKKLFMEVIADKERNPEELGEIIKEFKDIAKKYYGEGE